MGFFSVKNGQVEAEISQCKVHWGCSIFLPNLRIKYSALAHAQMLILVKKGMALRTGMSREQLIVWSWFLRQNDQFGEEYNEMSTREDLNESCTC